MSKETFARIQMISAMTIFGTIGLFVRLIPLPSSIIALCRAVTGMIFLGVVLLIRKEKPSAAAIGRNLRWLLPSGLFLGFNWILLFEAYRYTSVAVGTLCYYMAPVLVILVSPVLLREKLTLRKALCVPVALLGMVCISGVLEEGLPSAREGRGILMGLAAAALYAAIVLMNKQIRDIGAYDKTIFQLTVAALTMLPYCLLTEDFSALTLTPTSGLLLLLVGVVHTGVAYYLYFGSMAHISGQSIAIISYIDPVIAVVLSVLLLREPMLLTEAFGALLILGAALVSELPASGRRGEGEP